MFTGSQQPDMLLVIGWTWFHFIWQAVVIALFLRLTLWVIPARPAKFRYFACCLALFVLIATPLVTFALLTMDGPSQWLRFTGTRLRLAPSDGIPREWMQPVPSAEATGFLNRYIKPVVPWLGGVWFVAQVGFATRSLLGYGLLWRIRRRLEPNEGLQILVDRLAKEAGVRGRVTAYLSMHVSSPVTWGWLKPVVVMPAVIMGNLSPWEVELLIRHELAHIKRWDFLINFLQTIAINLLGLHPAAWWVSEQIREHREYCCDEEVVGAGSAEAMPYARALTHLEKLRLEIPELALAASGGKPVSRIRRLVVAGPSRSGLRGHGSAVVVNLAVAVMALLASSAVVSRLHAADVRERFQNRFLAESVYEILGRSGGDDRVALSLLDQKPKTRSGYIAFARAWNKHGTPTAYWSLRPPLGVKSSRSISPLQFQADVLHELPRMMWKLALKIENKDDAREVALAAVSLLGQDPTDIPTATAPRLAYDPLLPKVTGLSPRQIAELQLLAAINLEQSNRFFERLQVVQRKHLSFTGPMGPATAADRADFLVGMREIIPSLHLRYDLQWQFANSVYRFNLRLRQSQLDAITLDELSAGIPSPDGETTKWFGEQPLPRLLSEAELLTD